MSYISTNICTSWQHKLIFCLQISRPKLCLQSTSWKQMMMLLLGLMKSSLAWRRATPMVFCMVLFLSSPHHTETRIANGLSAQRYGMFPVTLPCTQIPFSGCFSYPRGTQEWPVETYPPWAHGPGYIISRDVAKFVVQGHQERTLQVRRQTNTQCIHKLLLCTHWQISWLISAI